MPGKHSISRHIHLPSGLLHSHEPSHPETPKSTSLSRTSSKRESIFGRSSRPSTPSTPDTHKHDSLTRTNSTRDGHACASCSPPGTPDSGTHRSKREKAKDAVEHFFDKFHHHHQHHHGHQHDGGHEQEIPRISVSVVDHTHSRDSDSFIGKSSDNGSTFDLESLRRAPSTSSMQSSNNETPLVSPKDEIVPPAIHVHDHHNLDISSGSVHDEVFFKPSKVPVDQKLPDLVKQVKYKPSVVEHDTLPQPSPQLTPVLSEPIDLPELDLHQHAENKTAVEPVVQVKSKTESIVSSETIDSTSTHHFRLERAKETIDHVFDKLHIPHHHHGHENDKQGVDEAVTLVRQEDDEDDFVLPPVVGLDDPIVIDIPVIEEESVLPIEPSAREAPRSSDSSVDTRDSATAPVSQQEVRADNDVATGSEQTTNPEPVVVAVPSPEPAALPEVDTHLPEEVVETAPAASSAPTSSVVITVEGPSDDGHVEGSIAQDVTAAPSQSTPLDYDPLSFPKPIHSVADYDSDAMSDIDLVQMTNITRRREKKPLLPTTSAPCPFAGSASSASSSPRSTHHSHKMANTMRRPSWFRYLCNIVAPIVSIARNYTIAFASYSIVAVLQNRSTPPPPEVPSERLVLV